MPRRTHWIVFVAALAAVPCAAGEWLVYIGGGIEPIEKGWTERDGQVLFTRLGGTLVTVPYDDVDLPASAFITWHLEGQARVPPRVDLPEVDPERDEAAKAPCATARLLALRGAETLEVERGGERETVHVACLDAPETWHRFPQLSWFGEATVSSVESAVPAGSEICLAEVSPPQRDGRGHRIVSVTLADGRDYVAEVIAGGLGLLRPGACRDAVRYRALEDRAIAARRGLWGETGLEPAIAAANHSGAAALGAPPPRRRRAVGGG